MTALRISGKLGLFGATMNPLHWQGALAATLVFLLAACGDKSSPASSPAPSSAPASPPAVQPTPATEPVTPQAPSAGPAAGGTAIGGAVAEPDKGTTKKGDAPAPTGGDGAATK